MTKPILRQGEDADKEVHQQQRRKSAALAWDEHNLDENDAYLASTTRTRIDEPKTPYNGTYHDLDDADDDASAARKSSEEELERIISDEKNERVLPSGADLDALTGEAMRRRAHAPAAELHSPGSALGEEDRFAAKRSAHYDEFRRVRELRERGDLEDDQDA